MPRGHGARIAAYNRARPFKISVLAGVAFLGRHHSKESRAKISSAGKGKQKSDETRQRMSKAQRGLEKSPEHRAALARAQTGRKLSVETRAKIGRASGGYSGGKRRWEWLEESGRLFRFKSTWERTFARRLEAAGLQWQYEPHALLLSDGRVYLPDFFVAEWQAYVEVKGWRGWRTMQKYDLAVKDGHRILLVTDPAVAFDELVVT